MLFLTSISRNVIVVLKKKINTKLQTPYLWGTQLTFFIKFLSLNNDILIYLFLD
jgi:hypothetical protein